MNPSTYEQHTVNSVNPLARFSHRTRLRFASRLVEARCPVGGAVVDFGAGTGSFLAGLHAKRGDLRLIGIEPYMTARAAEAEYVRDFAAIEDGTVDVVTALEVCEHLSDTELAEFLDGTSRVLREDGRLIVSVPVMAGPAVLAKELNRMVLLGKRDYRLAELATAAFGGAVPRAPDIKTSHKGFDHRVLRATLAARFAIEATACSPMRVLPWWLNSQVFFICAKKRRAAR